MVFGWRGEEEEKMMEHKVRLVWEMEKQGDRK